MTSTEQTKRRGKVLIVDDEIAVRRAVESTLKALNFEVSGLASGEEAIRSVQTTRYDVVLLDISMPGMSGIDTCMQLRSLSSEIGILMVTVHDSEEMIIRALDVGADDYLTKPFHMGELTARVRSLIRRSHAAETRAERTIAIGEIELNPVKHSVTRCGEFIHLTPKEFELLHYFMSNAGVPISHSRLLTAVWGTDYRQEVEYLRTFVRQLRKKLRDDASEPQYLTTISHVGYRFSENNETRSNAWSDLGE